MSKDIKLEILYYKSSTDVSLEFGLHGDYPLRLLSVSSSDMSQFFHNLKRAVSRSEIIIVVGALNDGEQLPHYLAKFIGRGVLESDNGDYGILEPGTTALPAGAIPLVVRGNYGGFIIESGPQTIFALNENRETRLKIVTDTIVGYISEHHKTYGNQSAFKRSESKVEPIVTDIVSSTTLDAPSADEIAVAELPSQFILEETPSDEPVIEINIDAEATDATDFIVAEDTECDIDFYDDEPVVPVANYPQNHRENRFIRFLCIVLSITVLLASIAFVVFDLNEAFPSSDNYYSLMAKEYNALSRNPVAAFNKIAKKNSNFFTWLRFSTLSVDHPVLHVSNINDNLKYLGRLPDGRIHETGSLISTTSTSPNIAEGNTVIYGNANSGGIFEMMPEIYDNAEAYNGTLVLTADNRYLSSWVVFSIFSSTDAGDFDFADQSKSDSYTIYLDTLKSLSKVDSDQLFNGNEKLLILVGVSENESYIAVSFLTSVRVFSDSNPVLNSNSSLDSTSSDSNSLGSASSDSSSSDEPLDNPADSNNDPESDDFQGDTPDIVLPSVPSVSKPSSTTSSSVASSTTASSSVSSSAVSSSKPTASSKPSESSKPTASSKPAESSKPTESSKPAASSAPASSSSVTSSTVASSPSSTTSSNTSSTPAIDPMYTWDKVFTITDSATGIKYTASAVDMVAMIIEDEMSPTIDPAEAVIAQAIVKYNWLLHNNGGSNALDPKPTAQAKQYAEAAKGSLIMYNNTVAKTYCYAYSAGKTANYQDIWGGTAYPYLQSVDCSVDKDLKDFETTTTYSAETIRNIIKSVCGIDVNSMDKSQWIVPTQYDTNGLYCVKVKIGGKEYKGTYLRGTLLTKSNTGVSSIRSSAYTVTYNEADDTFTVTCKGYGHGVGLSQRGAKSYAKLGWTHEQIIAHFFPGTTLIKN